MIHYGANEVTAVFASLFAHAATRLVQHWRRRIDAEHLPSEVGKRQRVAPRAASEIQRAPATDAT